MLRFGLRPLVAGLALAVATVLAATDHADARVGGRSSFGSRGSRTFTAPPSTRTTPDMTRPIERSTTQPGAATRPGSTTTGMGASTFGRPGLFGGGLLGGLAAGFLGAGLLGLLFGHGLSGGLAGFASFLGLVLQIGLLAFIGMLLFRMWQRRRQPALAGGPALRDIGGNRSGLGAMPMGGGASPRSGPTDEIRIKPADYDAFERLLGEIQTAFSAEDLNALRARVTPEMLSYFSEQLAENASRGLVNRVSDPKLEQGDLAEAWREGDTEYATVAMRFSLVDRMIERASGRMVGGSDARETVTEVWTFLRARNGPWMLSAIQQSD